MNNFISKNNLNYISRIEFTILKDTAESNLDAMEAYIDSVFKPSKNGSPFNIVYCYSLKNESISYPGGKSNVVYIGQTAGEFTNNKKSLSFRFKHCRVGSDNKSNIALRCYYEKSVELLLEIYDIGTEISREDEETKLRRLFLTKYSAYPIADGASYSKEKLLKEEE